MSIAFNIIGFLCLFIGIGLYGFNFKKKFYDYRDNFNLTFFKKNIKYLLIPALIFVCGTLLIGGGYYTSNVLSDLKAIDPEFKFNNIVLIFIFLLLFDLFLITFLTIMFILLYLINKRKTDKFKIWLRVIMYVSLVAAILCLYGSLEFSVPNLIFPLANRIIVSKEGIWLLNNETTKYNELMAKIGKSFKFEIALYALFIVSGACLVLYICDYKLWNIYGHHGLITTCFFVAFPCGILGARAWYVIGEWEEFASNPIRMFYIWEGGLAIMGGAVFGIIAGVIVMIFYKIKNERYKAIDYLLLVDIIVPTILVAQAIGRFGNFFNNEVHGNVVNESYFMWIPSFIRENMKFSSVHSGKLNANEIYLPLFFIEALVNITGYFFIEYGIKNLFGINRHFKHNYHADGSCVGWYIMWYGATRAILEPLRDSRFNMGSDGNFSNVSSYFMIGSGALIILICIVLKILNEKKIIVYQWQKYISNKGDKECIKQ